MGLIKKSILCFLLFHCIANVNLCLSQTNQCEIIAPWEPEMVMASRVPSTVTQRDHFLATMEWDSLDFARASDDEYLVANLDRYDRTKTLRFSNFDFNLPDLAVIQGLRISIEGREEGEGGISEMQFQFNTSAGPVGLDVSNEDPILGTAWHNDTIPTDRWWKFGYQNDLWNRPWTASEINSSDFGFILQIENQHDDIVKALIDQVQITVYYRPVYDICVHDCVVFSIDPIEGIENYNWEYPSNFELIESEVNQHILNLNILDYTAGNYQVCVTPQGEQRCCRDFVIGDCSLASVGNRVWKDSNRNGMQDGGEAGIPGVRVRLFNESGNYVTDQLTDGNGNYLFTDLPSGNYQIKTSLPSDDCEILYINEGSEDIDSDYDRGYGEYVSEYFYLAPGENNIDIDFAWAPFNGDIKGCVWRDRNGDGIRSDDPGIAGIPVSLFTCAGELVSTQETNSLGEYCFEALSLGEYYLGIPTQSAFATSVGVDSQFDTTNPSSFRSTCVAVLPGEISSLKLGLNPLGRLGDYIFWDENFNGFQDDGDWPIDNVTVYLYDGNNNVLDMTVTGEDGLYLFDNLPSGPYCIVVDYPGPTYLPTITNSVADTNIDSNGSDIGNSQVKSEPINLFDGATDLQYDFGFIKKTTTISGRYVRDANGDGLLASDVGNEGYTVELWNCNGPLIASRTTNSNGEYSFNVFVAEDYRVKFVPIDGMITSTLGESQIDNSTGEGFTPCYFIADETPLIVHGASIPVSNVGDRVWEDMNENNIYESGEPGIEAVRINLFNINGEMVNSTTTNAEGLYSFQNLAPDTCYMEIIMPMDFLLVEANVGTDETVDSDATMDGTTAISDEFILTDGYNNMDMDFGFRRAGGTVQGFVWRDSNGDNLSASEAGHLGAEIALFSCDGIQLGATTTNNDGLFGFTNVQAGDYYLVLRTPDGFELSVGGDSQIDNTLQSGSTSCFTVANNQVSDFNLGIIPTSSIGDFVWLDANDNGIQDNDEIGIADVMVELVTDAGIVSNNILTSPDGTYAFERILPGNYRIRVITPSGNYQASSFDVGTDDLDSDGMPMGDFVETSTFEIRDGVNQFNFDFGFKEVETFIQGTVWRDSNGDTFNVSEQGQAGILVTLFDCLGNEIDSQTTDVAGQFNFESLASGSYFIQVEAPEGYELVTGGDSDIDHSNTLGSTPCYTIDGTMNYNLTLGLVPLSSIGDFVWFDENENGIQDVDEPGFENLETGLFREDGSLLEIISTGLNGSYVFTNVRPGNYYVQVTLPANNFAPTITNATTADLDSEGTMVGSMVRSEIFTVEDGVSQLDHDFGFVLTEEEGNISGSFLRDQNGDGNLAGDPGIPNAWIILKSCDGTEVATTISNGQGLFSFENIPAGDYYLVFPEIEKLILLGYGDSEIDNVLEIGATPCFTVMDDLGAFVLAGSIPTARIGDFAWEDLNKDGIQDDGEPGIPGIDVTLFSSDGIQVGTTTTNGNGKYNFQNILPGDYYTIVDIGEYNISPSEASADDMINSDLDLIGTEARSKPFTIFNGLDYWFLDYGLYKEEEVMTSDNLISGVVFEDINGNGIYDNGEPRINDVTVNLIDDTGTIIRITTTFASPAGNGYYAFAGIDSGTYTVDFQLEEDAFPTKFQQGTNSAIDSDIVLENGMYTASSIVLTSDSEVEGLNAGFYKGISIGDYIWYDTNSNGIQDDDENGANDFIVRLYNSEGEELLSYTSENDPVGDDGGFYLFESLAPGEYYVGVNVDFGTTFAEAGAGNGANDSDVDGSNGAGTTASKFYGSGEIDRDLDIGILSTPGSVGDQLWLDTNGNGIQDDGELGLNDVEVSLFTESDELVQTTLTTTEDGVDGYYFFENVQAGNYYVVFHLPEGYSSTVPFRGGNSSDDSDVTNMIAPGSTNIFSVGSGIIADDIDCGIYIGNSIGDYIWRDMDQDGRQEFGEFGLADVEIKLYRTDEGEVDRFITEADGRYTFEDIRPGEYFLFVEMPEGFQFTKQYSGTDDSRDSNVDMTGVTELIVLTEGEEITSIDVGFVNANAMLGGRTWEDDSNGLQDFNENSLPGIAVRLLDTNMVEVDNTETNVMGLYAFANMTPGEYFIEFDLPNEYIFTVQDVTFNDEEDSDVNENGITDGQNVLSTTSTLNLDAGYVYVGLQAASLENLQLFGSTTQDGRSLKWEDQAEVLGATYQVLRSVDGITFETISEKIVGFNQALSYQDKSTHQGVQNYYYRIDKFVGKRLKAVSNIWMDAGVEQYEIASYPSPTSDVLFVQFDHLEQSDCTFYLYDMKGNLTKTIQIDDVKAGATIIDLDLSEVMDGNYILYADLGKQTHSEIITIIK